MEIRAEDGCVNFATKKKEVDISVGPCGADEYQRRHRNDKDFRCTVLLRGATVNAVNSPSRRIIS